MARYSAIIDTPWSAESAFDYLADATNFEQWDPGTVRSRHVAGPRAGLDAAYDVEADAIRGTTVMRYLTTRYEPPIGGQPGVVEMDVTTASLVGVDHIRVLPRAAGAQVTYVADLRFRGTWKLFAPGLALGFPRIARRAADGLAEALDGERATA